MTGAALSREAREALPDDGFAVPDKRRVPINDARHVRMGWKQIGQANGLTEHERTQGRLRIVAKARELGINTVSDNLDTMRIDAMAIEMPEVGDHPNRMPFSGVLVKLDEPSCAAPHGSSGKKIVMLAEAADRNLDTLAGMAVNYTSNFDGHDAQRKIGVITAATIEGSDLRIEGFIYAADFPKEAATIKADKSALGFSFEAQQIHVESLDGDPLVITDCIFTGAAILKKLKAAYTTTSLAASAAGDIEMTKEELLEAVGGLLKPVTDKITALEAGQSEIAGKIEAGKELQAKVAPFADKLRSTAEGMKTAGIGVHAQRGHVAILHRMADSMEAEAMGGSMPHIYRDTDYGSGMYAGAEGKPADTAAAMAAAVEAATKPLLERLGTVETKLTDGISAARDGKPAPERKTLSPAITQLLASKGIEAPGEGKKLGSEQIDKILAGMSLQDRLRKKDELHRDGLID